MHDDNSRKHEPHQQGGQPEPGDEQQNQFLTPVELASLEQSALETYVRNRLSGRELNPPLAETDESPRDFLEDEIELAREADRGVFHKFERVIQDILVSCDNHLGNESALTASERQQEVAVLSHCMYLAGKFHMKSCLGPIYNFLLDDVLSNVQGPLGDVGSLSANAVGFLQADRSTDVIVSTWDSLLKTSKNKRVRLAAFANLYSMEATKGREASQQLLRDWSRGAMGSPLNIPEAVALYFLFILDTVGEGPDATSLTSLIDDVIYWALANVDRSNVNELLGAMRQHPELQEYIPEAVASVTIYGIACEEPLRGALEDIANQRSWEDQFLGSVTEHSAVPGRSGQIAICVVTNAAVNGGPDAALELGMQVFREINRPDRITSYLIELHLWDQLNLLVEERTRHLNAGATRRRFATMDDTSRVIPFESATDLPAKLSQLARCAQIIRPYLAGNSPTVASVQAQAKHAAMVPGDVLYRKVESNYWRHRIGECASLPQDCFRATLFSLRNENQIRLDPADGIFGVPLKELTIHANGNVFNL